MRWSMQIQGGREVAQALEGLSKRTSRGLLRQALMTKAAPRLRQGMSDRAPEDPGGPDIKDHIGITAGRSSPDSAAVIVGPTKEIRADDPGRSFDEQAVYLEYGTEDTEMQAFVRPTFDQESPAVVKPVIDALWREITSRGLRAPSMGSGGFGGLL